MKKIGILYGHESTLPAALVTKINDAGIEGVSAEGVQVSAVELHAPPSYDVILDRISHDVPFYRSFLKSVALGGTIVLNNPFRCSSDDHFFQCELARQLRIAVPRTVLLPHKQHPPNITAGALRNLAYPLDWDAIFRHVGFPAYLKPVTGRGRRLIRRIHDAEEFFHVYHQTGDRCMVLQAAIETEEHYQCQIVGLGCARLMRYDPHRPPLERYLQDAPPPDPALAECMIAQSRALTRALGYAINRVEFALVDGTPQVVDIFNPAPEMELEIIGLDHFVWSVDALTDLTIQTALGPPPIDPCTKLFLGE